MQGDTIYRNPMSRLHYYIQRPDDYEYWPDGKRYPKERVEASLRAKGVQAEVIEVKFYVPPECFSERGKRWAGILLCQSCEAKVEAGFEAAQQKDDRRAESQRRKGRQRKAVMGKGLFDE